MHVASLIDSSTCVSCMFLCYMYVCVYMYMYSFIACYEVELHVYVRRMQVLGTLIRTHEQIHFARGA